MTNCYHIKIKGIKKNYSIYKVSSRYEFFVTDQKIMILQENIPGIFEFKVFRHDN